MENSDKPAPEKQRTDRPAPENLRTDEPAPEKQRTDRPDPENPRTDEPAPEKQRTDRPNAERQGTGFLSVMQSVFAAMVGVQSSENKERDFKHGKPLHFIVGGLLGTLVFILLVWLLVQYLLKSV